MFLISLSFIQLIFLHSAFLFQIASDDKLRYAEEKEAYLKRAADVCACSFFFFVDMAFQAGSCC